MSERQKESVYKTYRPPMPATWWLRRRRYFLFMMRELSSVFVALFLLLYLYEFFLLSKGPQVYGLFQDSLRSAGFLVFYAVVLVFSLYHTCTWFGVLGKIQVVRLGKWTVPPGLVTASAFGAWIAASLVIGWFFLR